MDKITKEVIAVLRQFRIGSRVRIADTLDATEYNKAKDNLVSEGPIGIDKRMYLTCGKEGVIIDVRDTTCYVKVPVGDNDIWYWFYLKKDLIPIDNGR